MEENRIPVVVTVSSASRGKHGELEEAMQLTMPGTLKKKGAERVLRYTETIQDKGDGSSVTHEVYVQLREGHVTVLRRGPYGMLMVFEQGKRYQTDYHTPYGDMQMGIYPTHVETELHEDRGQARLEYQLDLQGGYASVRRMMLIYTVPEKAPC